jgi:hypothetical protein
MTLVDKSGFSVRLTLWGKQAEQYNDSEATPVVAFKSVKVGEYQGNCSCFVAAMNSPNNKFRWTHLVDDRLEYYAN